MEPVAAISCQIVYGGPEGECFLHLPIFIDGQGACHVSFSASPELLSAEAAAAALSLVCQGSSLAEAERRRLTLLAALEAALEAAGLTENGLLLQAGNGLTEPPPTPVAVSAAAPVASGPSEGDVPVEPLEPVRRPRPWIHHKLRRLRSLDRHSAEAKDALRRALLSHRAEEMLKKHFMTPRGPRVFALSYTERRSLPWR